MALPKTADELKGLGWRYQNDSICKNCGQEIEWWLTSNDRWVPLLPMPRGSSPVITHFSKDCEEA